jgi:hypothetical protein
MKNDLTSIITFGYFMKNVMIVYCTVMVILAPIISIIICNIYKSVGERHYKTQNMIVGFLGLFLVIILITMVAIVPISMASCSNIEKKHMINNIFTYTCILVLATIIISTLVESIILIPLFFKKIYRPIFNKYNMGASDFISLSVLILMRTLGSGLGILGLILLNQNTSDPRNLSMIGSISVFVVVISASTITEIYNMYDIIKECFKKGENNDL